MKKTVLAFTLMVMLVAFAYANIQQELEQADELQEREQYQEQMDLLEGLLSDAGNDDERAEVYWRMSRATLGLGDLAKDAGRSDDDLIAIYEEAEGFADDAIDADADSHYGYFYKSANVGKAGQIRGVLNSLMSAASMRDLLKETIARDPSYAAAYFVLGQLYAQVPGVISFGNDDYAVSFARKSIELHETELSSGEIEEIDHDFYIQLASHLNERGWNARKRNREQSGKRRQYQNTSDPLEKYFYYEGTVNIADMDDSEEAEQILDRMLDLLRDIPSPTPTDQRNLEKAREIRDSL